MIGPNTLRFELERFDHGIGAYSLGGGRWASVLLCDGFPAAVIWNGPRGTARRFTGLAARLIAIKVPEIGRQIEHLPAWCQGPHASPEDLVFGRREGC